MLRHGSRPWFSSGMLAMFALAGSATVSDQSVLAQTGSCHLQTSAQSVPQGFGAAYNVFSTAKEVLLNIECGSSSNATLTVGNGQNTMYVYRFGYEWVNGGWKQISLEGERVAANDWYVGTAKVNLTRSQAQLAEDNFVVAYTCLWHNSSWKCGCRDTNCSQNYWQLQAFRQAAPGGSGVVSVGPNPFYEGGTSADISCVKRYRNVAWSGGTFAASLVGKRVSKANLTGWNVTEEVGLPWANPELATFAKAPDGSVAIRFDAIPGKEDYVNMTGAQLGSKGVQTACLSYKLWLPNGFYSSVGQNSNGHWFLVGKMPRLWGGPTHYRPACSLRSEALANGAGFTAALTPTNNKRFGVYYYDYSNLNTSNCGTGPRDDARTAPAPPEGRWIEFVNEVVMNSQDQKNGIQRMYVDDNHIVTVTGRMWEPSGKDWGVRGLFLLMGDDRLVLKQQTYFFYKDFVIFVND